MRFVCLSDTHDRQHGMKHEIPDGDVLLYAGDFCSYGSRRELFRFRDFLDDLPHKFKIVIAGNHDKPMIHDVYQEYLRETGVIFLYGDVVEIEGIVIYGSPWVPRFGPFEFMYDSEEQARSIWDRIDSNTNILLTHGPSYGVMDLGRDGKHAGCAVLSEKIKKLPNLKFHVFGHIHPFNGVQEIDGITHINAAICDNRYRPTQPPIVFDYKKEDE